MQAVITKMEINQNASIILALVKYSLSVIFQNFKYIS